MPDPTNEMSQSRSPSADPPRLLDALVEDHAITGVPELRGKLLELRRDAPSASAPLRDRSMFLADLSRVLFLNQLQRAMQRFAIPFPVYNHLEDFRNNEAPWAPPLRVRPIVPGKTWRLLGRDIGIPIGIPASVLTMNAEWVGYHAQNGFNVLTYKTVRPRRRRPLVAPNWIFLSSPSEPIQPDQIDKISAVGDLTTWPSDPFKFSTANSFGVPSEDPDDWVADVETSVRRLASDQLLILSVMGTFEEKQDAALVEDFAEAARRASSTGVSAIEVNLSCPNGVVDGQLLPPVYENRDMVLRIVDAVTACIDPAVSLIVKFGYMTEEALFDTLAPIADVVDGVSGINTLQVPVKGPDELNPFPGRPEAGISGYILRDLALDFVRSAAAIRDECSASYDIIGMGGVMSPDHAVDLYKAGASAVQTASGAFFNHYLARQLVEEWGSQFPLHEPSDLVNMSEARRDVLTALTTSGSLTIGQLTARSRFTPSAVRTAVEDLTRSGEVRRLTHSRDVGQTYSLSPG